MTLTSVHGQLLRYFLGFAVASGMGLGATNLDGLPGRIVEDALTGTVDPAVGESDRTRVLSALAADPHAEIRVAVADALGNEGTWDHAELDLLSALAIDVDPGVREAAAASFPSLLERAPFARRLEAAATWATADHEAQRLAVARGLSRRVPVPAADIVLAHLIDDPSARVRRTALESVRERYLSDPRVVQRLAGAAVADASRPVRHFARHLFVGACAPQGTEAA